MTTDRASLIRTAILFGINPLEPSSVEEGFEAEEQIAAELGLDRFQLNIGAAMRGDIERSLYRVPPRSETRTVVGRGSMGVSRENYRRLCNALFQRGLRLINSPEQYENTYWFPNLHRAIGCEMPRAVWIDLDVTQPIVWDAILSRLAEFGDQPVLVKDFVKSQKSQWHEACFIPRASDSDAVQKVVTRFLDLRCDEFVGGLVFKEFVALEPAPNSAAATTTKDSFPRVREYRLFVLDRRILAWAPYWTDALPDPVTPPLQWALAIAKRIDSRFFTLDIARTANGQWLVIEANDGQMSGAPVLLDRRALLSAFRT